jgi:PKD repeat protein
MSKICFFALLLCPVWAAAQISYTANDTIRPYNGDFRAGINLDMYRGFSDEQLGILAAGKPDWNVPGVGVKALRPGLFDDFLENYGYTARLNTFRLWDSLGLQENTVMVGFPSENHRDSTQYCSGIRSTLFANMYEPIWDNGEHGTPINERNFYALYLYKTVLTYKKQVKFWEIWNEPGFDYTTGKGWLPRGAAGNWWENNPSPCDYKLRAPIFGYIRLLRISYEVIKHLDSTAYVSTSGLGYPSFLDAILRNSDNPVNGSVTSAYPQKGGAYFDAIAYHTYPHFDGSLRRYDGQRGIWIHSRNSDAAAKGIDKIKNDFQAVLDNYGYNGRRFPNKMWLITEANLPRKAFGDFIGSERAQRNYVMKAYIQSIQSDIKQLHIFKIAENTDTTHAFNEFDVMGLYQKLDFNHSNRQQTTESGTAYRTISKILFGLKYDSLRTRQLNLNDSVKIVAFRDIYGNYTYALWAKTLRDNNESAEFVYNFPQTFQSTVFRQRDWRYTDTWDENFVDPLGIKLKDTPIFLTEQKIVANKLNICTGFQVNYTAPNSNGLSKEWTFEGGNITTSNIDAPSVIYARAGIYNTLLVLKTANGQIAARQSIQIAVTGLPKANFNYTATGNIFQFQNQSSLNTHQLRWDFGDSSYNSDANPTHSYYRSQPYLVRLKASNFCGSDSIQKTINVQVADIKDNTITADDQVPRHDAPFRAGVNLKYIPNWKDEEVADIAAGNLEKNIGGIGAKTLRATLPDYFTHFWGIDVRKTAFEHYANLDLQNNTLIIGFPDQTHRDSMRHCPTKSSELFKNLYADIWDSGAQGTPVNDTNYFAVYVWNLVKTYKNQIKYWSVWDSPGVDESGEYGWLPKGKQGNWWENNPEPCDLGIHAPIQHFVRMMRVAYEVIKSEDSTAFVTFDGAGYPSFLDAVCRNTDNPTDGSVKPIFPKRGGAYFDAVSFNSAPHFDGTTARYDIGLGRFVYQRTSDAGAAGILQLKQNLDTVLKNYGYNGVQKPVKRFLIGQAGLPRKMINGLFGGDYAQLNYVMKAYVYAMTNGITTLNFQSIVESQPELTAREGNELIGFYQKPNGLPYQIPKNLSGIAFKTVNNILFGLKYDTLRTQALALPQGVKGFAFKDAAGKYTYMLWAVVETDLSESAYRAYNFPNSFHYNQLYKKQWDYSERQTGSFIATNPIILTETPIFLSETMTAIQPPVAAFQSNTQFLCPPLTVQFTNLSQGDSVRNWYFEGGNPSVSQARNPMVTYAKGGKYDVKLAVQNPQGSHFVLKTQHVMVNSIPNANFKFEIDTPHLSVLFQHFATNTYSITWDFGDGVVQNALNQQVTHRYNRRGIYLVRLILRGACGRDTVSKWVDIRTTDLAETGKEGFNINCFPNPFHQDLNIQIDLKEKSHLTLELWDMQGKKIVTLCKNQFYTSGNHLIKYNSNRNLPQGVYLLKIQTDPGITHYTKLISTEGIH